MRPQTHSMILLFFALLLSPLSLRAQAVQEAPMVSFQIQTADYTSETQIRPADVNDLSMADLKEGVSRGSALITLNVQGPGALENAIAELGHFDSEMTVTPSSGPEYAVGLTLIYRDPEGREKKVSGKTVIENGKAPVFDSGFREKIAVDFADLVAGQPGEMQTDMDPHVVGTLREFSLSYVKNFFTGAPATVKQVVGALNPPVSSEREVVIEETIRRQAGPRPIVDPLEVRQQDYERQEKIIVTDAVFNAVSRVVPQHAVWTFFRLTARESGSTERFRLADVNYLVLTVPTPLGQLLSEFKLTLEYRNTEPLDVSIAITHDKNIPEHRFFEIWKERFLGQVEEAFLKDIPKGDALRARKMFLTYLEPYLYEEFYDLDPLLVKAQMVFQSRPMQKKILNELKERHRAQQEAIRAARKPS